MRGTKQVLGGLMLAVTLGSTLSTAASADCLRSVHNRSPYTLVVTLNDGLSMTVHPRSTGAVRLSGPGSVEVAAYCSGADASAPILRRSFDYQAVQDRCFYAVGHPFFERELGNGFLPRASDTPFALNNPRQGDLVLFARGSECLPTR